MGGRSRTYDYRLPARIWVKTGPFERSRPDPSENKRACVVTKDDLIRFEKEVSIAFASQQCKGPVHLSGGNEEELIEIFKDIKRTDWVFSTYRSHYHALLHGIEEEWLFDEIRAGRSMNIMSPKHKFFSSAIVGGCLPIAVGVASALHRLNSKDKVWCFVGDMCQMTGNFQDALQYSEFNCLPTVFVVEDNGMSCDSPTMDCWGVASSEGVEYKYYKYQRIYPHVGIGRNVF